jgi:hypothetical protein
VKVEKRTTQKVELVNAAQTDPFGLDLNVLLVSCLNITIMTANLANNAHKDNTFKEALDSASQKVEAMINEFL